MRLAVVVGVAGGMGTPSGALAADIAAALARDRAALCSAASALSRTAVKAPFARMRAQVDVYADWVFGWRSSLTTTFELMGIAAREAAQAPGPAKAIAVIEARYGDYIRDRFLELVVRPALVDGGRGATDSGEVVVAVKPAEDLVTWLRRLDADLAADRTQWLRGVGGVEAETLVARYGQPLLPTDGAWGPVATPAPHDLPGDQVRLVLLRSLRPLGSRAVGILVRLSVFEAVASAVVFQSPEVTWLAGLAASSGAAVTMTALVDGAANWVHEWVGRAALVDELRTVVDTAEIETARSLYMRMAAEMAALEPPVACPPSLAPTGPDVMLATWLCDVTPGRPTCDGEDRVAEPYRDTP